MNCLIPHSKQKEVIKSDKRFRVLNWGRRGGKTSVAVEEIIGRSVFVDGSNVVYIAPTHQQAKDIAWADLKKRTGDVARKINETRLEIDLKESRILLRGWEAVESLRGQFFDLMVLDEVASMKNFWENWEQILAPTLLDKKGKVMFISTPKGFNHFYELYNKAKSDEEWESFHATTYDNPYIEKEEIEKIKKQTSYFLYSSNYTILPFLHFHTINTFLF